MISTYNVQFDTILCSPPDQREGAILLHDTDSKEVILRAWIDDHEVAFTRIPVDGLLNKLGIVNAIEARVKQGIAEGLRARSADLDARCRTLDKEPAEHLCPFRAGDVIEVSSPKKGRYEVCSIHCRHRSWSISCFKVNARNEKVEHHPTEFNDTAKLKLVIRPSVQAKH